MQRSRASSISCKPFGSHVGSSIFPLVKLVIMLLVSWIWLTLIKNDLKRHRTSLLCKKTNEQRGEEHCADQFFYCDWTDFQMDKSLAILIFWKFVLFPSFKARIGKITLIWVGLGLVMLCWFILVENIRKKMWDMTKCPGIFS